MNFVLRAQDAKECLGIGMTPEEGVLQSVALSDYWDAVYIDGKFAAVWGYARQSLFSAKGFMWVLTTDAITPHKLFFAKQSLRCMNHVFERFHEINAIVHKDYDASRKWLEWLGFKQVGTMGDYLLVSITKGEFRWHS